MSIATELVDYESFLTNAYGAAKNKKATMPEQQNLQNLTPTIESIPGGGDCEGQYVWAKYSDYIEEKIPENTTVLIHMNESIIDEFNNYTRLSSGEPNYAEGKFDKSLVTSNSQAILIPYNSKAFGFTNQDWTVSGWFYRTSTGTSDQTLFGSRERYSSTYGFTGWVLQINGSTQNFVLSANVSYSTRKSSNTVNSTSVFPLNTWTHIAVVKKETNLYLFVNGEKIITVDLETDTIYNPETYLFIGGIHDNSTDPSSTSNYFMGKIDEFIVVNGTALWTESFTPPTLAYGDSTGTFEGYVVSDDENAYPNDDYAEDGYYYKKGFMEGSEEMEIITGNGWTAYKHQSGLVTLTKHVTFTDISLSAWGALYSATVSDDTLYPVELISVDFKSATKSNDNTSTRGFFPLNMNNGNEDILNTYGYINLVSHNNSTLTSAVVDLLVIGRWK